MRFPRARYRFRDGEGKAYGGGFHDSTVKTNAVGQQGQYGNGDGYHAAGGQAADGGGQQPFYGPVPRVDVAGPPPALVTGTPFLVTGPEAGPQTPIVHLPPQYAQQQTPQYVPQAPYVPQEPYVPVPPAPPLYVPPGPYSGPVSPYPSVVPQLQPYQVQLPALSLSARSPSGQYVVPMPPKLYVDKPNVASDG